VTATTAATDPLAPRLRWWGWGPPAPPEAAAAELPPAADVLLRELGAGDVHRRPVALEAVTLPESALDTAALAAVVGDAHVRADRLTRVSHAAGRSYIDLLRLWAGDASGAPDAVVYPGTPSEVAAVLELCARTGIAVIPFGGGTSVVGGVNPARGGHRAAITLDLARLDRLVAVDPVSLTATVQAGMTGPALEAALAGHGLTLGHHPQSFEFSTVGGWVATRSAGQASTGYGAIADLVAGVRCATPVGELDARALPATAAGPDLRQLVVGSEGALGVITQVTLRVRPLPGTRRYEAWTFPSFAAGAEALRALAQAGAAPDVARLSDEQEVRMNRLVAAHSAAAPDGRVAAIFGWEGEGGTVADRARAGAEIARAHGGAPEDGDGGEQWVAGRYAAPYLRDLLMTRGVLAETLETAGEWSALGDLRSAVTAALRDALAARGTAPLVLCHISHVYADGASLYFTILAAQQPGAEIEQWQAAKAAATSAMLEHGGTVSHHHAVGRDHAPWLEAEIGATGLATLRAAKAQLDPAGVMNPGVLGL
jgi:alkyldihydroxyacetonephosphate synthase